MYKHKISILFIVAIAIVLSVSPAFAGMSGTALTGVNIQNLSDKDDATFVVQLIRQDGLSVNSLTPASAVKPGALKNYYMPSESSVPSGSYAMIVSSNTPTGAIVRTDWDATGGAGIYSNVKPSGDITIPLITKLYATQNSEFTVQNTDTSADATDVEISLYQNGSSTPVKVLTNQTINAGRSKTYKLSDSVWGVANGFVGSVRIKSSKDLVAQSFIDLVGSNPVTAFNGVPTSSAAETLYCPLIRANYYGDTGISIVNPNNTDATVTITFAYSSGPASTPGSSFTQTLLVPANSSAIAFQGPGGNSRLAPTNLPAGGASANSGANPVPTNTGASFSATIQAPPGKPVMAVVNDTLFNSNWSAKSQSTYNCPPPAETGTVFGLPLIRKYHLSTARLTTGIAIQNVTNAVVTVNLEVYNSNGSRNTAAEPAPIQIQPYSATVLWNGSLPNVDNWYGSGILKASGGKIAVIVSDEGFGSKYVDSANYNGLLMAP